MEDKEKIVKVYSNNSKKSRLKRNKNKFQRVWDAEKQTYIKVRKSKFYVHTKRTKNAMTEKEIKKKMKAVATRKQNKLNKKKIVEKPKVATTKKMNAHPVTKPARKAVTVSLYGLKHVWDDATLRYKIAAL